MPFTPQAHPGIVHHFTRRLIAFEHATPSTNAAPPHNFILFLGGLGDSILTVRYPTVLSILLPPTWSLAQVQLTSTGPGWTTTDLAHDVIDLSHAVTYFRTLAASRNPSAPANIILLGHSTGSQIAASYLIGPWKSPSPSASTLALPRVDAVVLQAGISDRDGIVAALPADQLAASLDTAKQWVADGRAHDHLPLALTTDIFVAAPSAARWISLADPQGDDDLFSADLGDDRVARVWGASGLAGRKVPVLVLWGAEDEHVPKHVDRAGLLERWRGAVVGAGGDWDVGSGLVPGATHNLNGSKEEAVRDLCGRIVRLVERVQGGVDGKL